VTPGDQHVVLGHPHGELLERALAIEANAKPSLTSVVGLGRSFSWAEFLADLDDTPLFDCGT
jgi:DNA polymerase III delta subunit